jgi:hypothetical protein
VTACSSPKLHWITADSPAPQLVSCGPSGSQTPNPQKTICGRMMAEPALERRAAPSFSGARASPRTVEITMEIYTEVSDDATRAGLKKLGDSLA